MTLSKFINNTQGLFENDPCFSTKHNNTVILNVYGGIPETIILNLITWVLLLLLFALLRNRAWDYGRLALVQNEKWTQLFYKNTEDAVAVEETTADASLSADSGCCSWFPAVFKISKHRVFARCGPDASHYLSFQRHLLVLSAIIMLCSVCIILPINFKGELQGDKYSFGHTTVSNLDPNSQWLWIHVIMSFCFVPLTVLIMRRCSSRIPIATPVSSQTVMVTHISRNHRNTEDIRNYFSVRYPNIELKDVQMAYKIKELTNLEQQREFAHEAKLFCIQNNEHDMKVQPYGCIICCPWRTKNALEYYTAEEERLYNLVLLKRAEALQQPLGIAFITVGTEEAAQYVVHSFIPGTRFHWTIGKAPAPPDIIWENLQVSSRNWYLKAILINCFLFVLLFFLTTPAIIVTMLNTFASSKEDVIKKVSPVLSEFLPTLMLLTISAIMPVIVAYSDQWMSHWTKSEQNFATMQKTFYFLLFMVLILPSLGLTSAQALVEWSVQSQNRTYRWECIFLPDKGAFFVNYIITSSLIGTALELLRFPELAMYVWRLILTKSSAEKINIQKEILSEFPFGIHYAWTLLIFTTSTAYSLICPLITPFGFLYLCLKHLVDKHNIYFVYRPSGMCGEGQKIHVSAVRNVRLALILLQIIMLAFSIIRGDFGLMSIIIILGIVATSGFFVFLGPFPSCTPNSVSVNKYMEHNEKYIAPVLVKVYSQSDTTTTAINPDYGSSSVNDSSKILASSTSVST